MTPTLPVVDEIRARAPGFFDDTVLTVHGDDLDGGPAQKFRAACAAHGVRWARGDAPSDPVALELLRGVRDTARPELAGGVGSPEETDVAALLRAEYREVAGLSGASSAFVRRRGTRPLLLLNALGLPIRLWSQFLGGDHGHRVVVPVLPSCDLLAGGMVGTSSATQLAETLRDLLEHLDLGPVDVLAWCNGGRVGVELMRVAPRRSAGSCCCRRLSGERRRPAARPAPGRTTSTSCLRWSPTRRSGPPPSP